MINRLLINIIKLVKKNCETKSCLTWTINSVPILASNTSELKIFTRVRGKLEGYSLNQGEEFAVSLHLVTLLKHIRWRDASASGCQQGGCAHRQSRVLDAGAQHSLQTGCVSMNTVERRTIKLRNKITEKSSLKFIKPVHREKKKTMNHGDCVWEGLTGEKKGDA